MYTSRVTHPFRPREVVRAFRSIPEAGREGDKAEPAREKRDKL